MHKNSIFAVLGYFCTGFEYNYKNDKNFAKKGEMHY